MDCPPMIQNLPETIVIVENKINKREIPFEEFPGRFRKQTTKVDGYTCTAMIPVTKIEIFMFDKSGELVPAENAEAILIVEYDSSGHVLMNTHMEKQKRQ